MALAGGHERRGAGGGALRQPTQQTRPSADRGTGLGLRASRTEAQARHPVDPLGRIHRREPGRLLLLALCCGPTYVTVARAAVAFPGLSRNINWSDGSRDYRAFRNVISDGNGRCDGLVCRLEISTLASAFA